MFTVYGMMSHVHALQQSGVENDAEMNRMGGILPYRLINHSKLLDDSKHLVIRVMSKKQHSIVFGVMHTPSSRTFIFETYNDRDDTLVFRRTRYTVDERA
jgi:hypothetical protein